MTEPIDNIAPSKLTNKLQTLPTSEDCTSNHIWRFSQIMNLFWDFNSDSHEMAFFKFR